MTEIIFTKDGSHSLLNTELNETYHSVHGALQESIHVFVKSGLEYFITQHQPQSISIFEVGFGTGLNALLTLQHALNKPTSISYHSIEAFPIDESLWTKLNYAESLGMTGQFEQLHRAGWDRQEQIAPNFNLRKIKASLEQIQLPENSFDLIYFDAFAPNKQPEMWTVDILGKTIQALKSHGVFVTYCAKGQLKRDLKSLGLQVETLPGPPGKKEMVRGIKN